jgi:hypothetical protein
MDVSGTIERYLPEGFIAIVVYFLSSVLLPYFNIEPESLRILISIVFVIIVVLIVYTLFQPCVSFEFGDPNRDCILTNTDIGKRAGIFSVDVFITSKFDKIHQAFHMKDDDLSHLFYQIYWTPRDVVTVKRNQNYSALMEVDFYPSIRINDLQSAKDSHFSFKIAFSPKHPEINKVVLEIRRFIQSPCPLKLRLFLLFCRIKSNHKTISIRR